ncbi:MAG TPA: kinase, partial [Pseudoxanthomonas sp.]|nr:kinase [Pseudoxanthomonas sp.]
MHPQPVGFASDLVDAALRAALAVPARVPVFALSGLQGTGKSTLAAQMAARAQAQGQRAVVLSLDDLYLRHADRQHLAHEVHPLLATRGPPGTHDVALGCRVLDALRTGQAITLPRFDKLADDRLPLSQADAIDAAVDLVIVEGWCLGASAEDDAALEAPLNALEREEDPQAIWRR